VAVPSKAWVCSRSLAETMGSNPPGVWMFLSLVSVVCYQIGWSLRRADQSTRGALPNVACPMRRSDNGANMIQNRAKAPPGTGQLNVCYFSPSRFMFFKVTCNPFSLPRLFGYDGKPRNPMKL
jgi:hypothetical protein